jgi:hypothetical protein
MGRIKEQTPDLFSLGYPAGRARNTDPVTSHLAAARNPSGRITMRMRALIAHGQNRAGLTDYELAAILGAQQNSVGKRRGELCEERYIEKTEMTRPAPSGSQAIVWRITLLGIAKLADVKP